MRSALVIILFCTSIFASQVRKKNRTKTYQFSCMEETKVDADLLLHFNAGNLWQKDYPILKKWVLCVLRKMKLMSAEGVYKLDVAMDRIPVAERNEADIFIDKCLSTKALPPEEIAWKYVKCLHEQDKKHNFPTITIFY